MTNDSVLGFALLGLMHSQPMSGYDLRKVFTTTAMGSFSDSPGAIYPALRRLEARGLARGTVAESASLRKRRVFRITAKGLAAFKAWLVKPVTRDVVIRRSPELILRFAFMDDAVGAERAKEFLRQWAAEIADYLPELQKFLASHTRQMPLCGRLALECGIEEYEMRLCWARRSIALYERGKGKEV